MVSIEFKPLAFPMFLLRRKLDQRRPHNCL